MRNLLLLAVLPPLVSGCASIVTGQNQTISVETVGVNDAKCSLANDEGTWFTTTPGSVTVKRSYSNLNVTCKKDQLTGCTSVKSSTKGMAFGNILAGGIIGAAVDCGTGSAYDYPTVIKVDMN